MTNLAADETGGATPAAKPPRPLWWRIIMWALIVVVIGALANLLGWNLRSWFHNLWQTLTSISIGSLIAGIVLMIVQTSMTAYAWYAILKYAYPERTRWKDILAGYAVSVALNGFLPANLGTLVFLIMLTTFLAVSFAAVLGAYAVEKIFFTVAGAFTYLFLFFTIGGSFDIGFGFVHQHPAATIIVIGGGILMLVLLVRRFWPKVVDWWNKAKEGGAILGRPSAFFGRVFLPSFISWCAGLGVIAVFLHAYSIPVSFDTLMRVAGGNSLANVTSVTPGGVGVTQAWNVASLQGVGVSSTDATAYSIAQQLVSTAWSIVFALILMVWAWGWGGGKQLVTDSYEEAKRRQQEEAEKRRAKKEARAAEKAAE